MTITHIGYGSGAASAKVNEIIDRVNAIGDHGSYANAAGRDAEITAPVAGMTAYLQDVDVWTWHDGTAWRGTWTAFSPACQFNASATNVTSSGEYMIDMQGIVHFEIQLNTTGAVGAGDFTCTLPFPVRTLARTSPAVAYGQRIGTCSIIDAGTGWRSGTVYVASGAASTAKVDLSHGIAQDFMRQTAPMTWANGDGALLVGAYRKA